MDFNIVLIFLLCFEGLIECGFNLGIGKFGKSVFFDFVNFNYIVKWVMVVCCKIGFEILGRCVKLYIGGF